MGPVLAVLQPWHAITLIFISCVALIISLYSLLFTVPIKRFWEHIESLGGGLEGVKKHMEGVKADVSRRVDSIEEQMREQIEAETQDLQKKTDRLATKVEDNTEALSAEIEKAQKRLQELKKALATARSELEEVGSDKESLARAVTKLSERVDDLESDFESIDMELRESIARRVSESQRQVEASVLSALDAIQDQILDSSAAGSGSRSTAEGRWSGRTRDSSEEGADGANIISAEPLFSHLENGGKDEEARDDPEDEEDENDRDSGSEA